jgi:hypothetical protein
VSTAKSKPIQVYVRPDQLDPLRYLAARRDVSISHLVREGIDHVLASVPAEEDPLLDIIGMIEGGPSDLSVRHDDYLAEAYADYHDSCAPKSS